jgi:hypothetical protein
VTPISSAALRMPSSDIRQRAPWRISEGLRYWWIGLYPNRCGYSLLCLWADSTRFSSSGEPLAPFVHQGTPWCDACATSMPSSLTGNQLDSRLEVAGPKLFVNTPDRVVRPTPRRSSATNVYRTKH